MPPRAPNEPENEPGPPPPDLGGLPTIELLEEVRRKSRAGWEELYRRYRDFLVGCVRRKYPELWMQVDLEDVVHDVFLKLHEDLASHRYTEESKFRPWLRTVVLNRFADHWRACEVRRADALDTSAEVALSQRSWEEDSLTKALEREEEVESVYRALAELPDEDADVVIARICEKKDWAAIGEILGCKRTAARTRFLDALDRLNRALERGSSRGDAPR